MALSTSDLFPHIIKLGNFFKTGADYYAALKESGATSSPDVLAAYIDMQMISWNPKISGKPLLDDQTKKAAARMLAGIIINMTAISS